MVSTRNATAISGQLISVSTSVRDPAEAQGGEHVQPRHARLGKKDMTPCMHGAERRQGQGQVAADPARVARGACLPLPVIK